MIDRTDGRGSEEEFDVNDEPSDFHEAHTSDIVKRAVADAVERFPHNILDAVNYMEDRIMKDTHLFRVFAKPLVRTGCKAKISEKMRSLNSKARNGHDPTGRGDRLHLAAEAEVERLMDYRLAGGYRLGEATRDVLLQNSDFHYRQARTMATTARWLKLIAKHLDDMQRVEEALSEEELRDLQDKAKTVSLRI